MKTIGLKSMSKKGLAVALSAIEGFKEPKVSLEQYVTDSEIAATVLWEAYIAGDIKGKEIADLGCGTGVLGVGCMLLGAKKVHFVDIDGNAIEKARESALMAKSECSTRFSCVDIKDFDAKADVVFMNPPFGTKSEHKDREFLEKAVKTGDIVYSFHKSESKRFIEAFCLDNGFFVSKIYDFKFPLKATMGFHRKKKYFVDASCFRLVKSK